MKLLFRICAVFWLIFVMPFFGIIPLLQLLDVSIGYGTLHRLEGDILRLAWSLFFGDPAPEATHAYPPITEQQYWIMIIIVLSGSALALYYCYVWLSQKRQVKRFK